MLTLSKKAQILPASPIRKLVPYAEAAKKRGITVYHLNIGQPDIESPATRPETSLTARDLHAITRISESM